MSKDYSMSIKIGEYNVHLGTIFSIDSIEYFEDGRCGFRQKGVLGYRTILSSAVTILEK